MDNTEDFTVFSKYLYSKVHDGNRVAKKNTVKTMYQRK